MARASAKPLLHLFQLAILLHRLFDLAQSLGRLLIFLVVVDDFGQCELRLQLVISLLHLFQTIDHVPSGRLCFALVCMEIDAEAQNGHGGGRR